MKLKLSPFQPGNNKRKNELGGPWTKCCAGWAMISGSFLVG